MKKTLFLCVMAFVLVISVILSSFFGYSVPAVSDSAQNTPKTSEISTLDFSLRLLYECAAEGENILVSPLCASSALTAAALGAEGSTRTQLEAVLISDGDLESLSLSLGKTLSDSDGAVSLWANNDGRLVLHKDYVRSVENALRAEVSLTDFGSVLHKMNTWVEKATDGKITSIVNDIPPEAVLYILSALTFDGEWVVPYTVENVSEGEFFASDGSVCNVEFMKSTESIYLETKLAVGFAKPYTDGSYFMALLPNEGISITDMLSSLDGAAFEQMMNSVRSKSVSVCLPKFTAESELSLAKVIADMGAPDAFSMNAANFSAMGSDALYISDFMQNTYLSVDENGTQGGAAAGVEVSLKSMPTVSVVFNRPFVYFIVKDGVLLFAGVLESF